jgi:hypothetical protein
MNHHPPETTKGILSIIKLHYNLLNFASDYPSGGSYNIKNTTVGPGNLTRDL